MKSVEDLDVFKLAHQLALKTYSSTVLHILGFGECIEDYPDDYPFPSGLFFGWHEANPLHVVAALEETGPRFKSLQPTNRMWSTSRMTLERGERSE